MVKLALGVSSLRIFLLWVKPRWLLNPTQFITCFPTPLPFPASWDRQKIKMAKVQEKVCQDKDSSIDKEIAVHTSKVELGNHSPLPAGIYCLQERRDFAVDLVLE